VVLGLGLVLVLGLGLVLGWGWGWGWCWRATGSQEQDCYQRHHYTDTTEEPQRFPFFHFKPP